MLNIMAKQILRSAGRRLSHTRPIICALLSKCACSIVYNVIKLRIRQTIRSNARCAATISKGNCTTLCDRRRAPSKVEQRKVFSCTVRELNTESNHTNWYHQHHQQHTKLLAFALVPAAALPTCFPQQAAVASWYYWIIRATNACNGFQ